jgi:hypothetical protein
VVAEAVRIIDLEAVETLELARRGIEPWAGFAAAGNPAAFAAEAAWIRDNGWMLLG